MKSLPYLLAAISAFSSTGILSAADAAAPVYYAQIVVEVTESLREPERTEETLKKYLPKNDSTITIKKQRNTGLFEVGATRSTAKAAAARANELAGVLKSAMGDRVILREKAEAPVKPVAAR